VEVLNLCALLGSEPQSVLVLGVQPADIQPYGLELTEKVAARVGDLVQLVVEELKRLGVSPQKKV
jgi:hydrogenase maturation protease